MECRFREKMPSQKAPPLQTSTLTRIFKTIFHACAAICISATVLYVPVRGTRCSIIRRHGVQTRAISYRQTPWCCAARARADTVLGKCAAVCMACMTPNLNLFLLSLVWFVLGRKKSSPHYDSQILAELRA